MNAAVESRIDRWRGVLWWAVPFAALALLLGIETDWGRAVHRLPEPLSPIEPKPVTAGLLPEYAIEGGLQRHSESVSRTLFNPTRRPAPVVVAEAVRPKMNKGQFVLTGTAVAGTHHLAFLKEVSGGKSRVVRQGDQLNGALVAEVKPGRVRLTLADDFEELVLKAQPGPKTTTQPPGPPLNPSGVPVPSGGLPGAAPPASATGNTPDGTGAADVPAPSRRPAPQPNTPTPAAPGAAAGAATPAAPAPKAGQGTAASPDPSWNEVFERMRQRSPQPTK
ncbi:MAG: hypothetical protein ABI537_14020 [Casimicrobiaceae bacterium]